MKKIIFLLSLILSLLWIKAQSNIQKWNEMTIVEDKNVKINLLYATKADIGDTDWLKLKITNKTSASINLVEANYSLNEVDKNESGDKNVDYGAFGQGNKYDLLHHYYNLTSLSELQKDVIIEPNSSLFAWIYLTNYASVLIDNRSQIPNEICASLQLNLGYEINGKLFKLNEDDANFCFQWVNSKFVSNQKLVNRLRDIILNPFERNVNVFVTSHLMNNQEVASAIFTDDIVQGIISRKNISHNDETILLLTELSKRNAIPNITLTEFYRNQIKNNFFNKEDELKYYWDNSLLDELLNSNISWRFVQQILEINARFWSNELDNRYKVFSYFSEAQNFNKYQDIKSYNLNEWSKIVKTLSTSRSPELIEYLISYLDNETEFIIEDWSKYGNYSKSIPTIALSEADKPDFIKVRICDVAFVSILRALDQFEFEISSKIGTKYLSMKFKNEILTDENIKRFKKSNISDGNINLDLFEREIKLTPELKKKLL